MPKNRRSRYRSPHLFVDWARFAREHRLLHGHVAHIEQASVRWHEIAGRSSNEVTRDDGPNRNLLPPAIALDGGGGCDRRPQPVGRLLRYVWQKLVAIPSRTMEMMMTASTCWPRPAEMALRDDQINAVA
jgi:hypothetical protein